MKSKGKKQFEALKALAEEKLDWKEGIFSKHMRTDRNKNEIDEIEKWEDRIKQKDSKYEVGQHNYDFQRYKTIQTFGESIFPDNISIPEADMDQTNLLENMKKNNDKSSLKAKRSKDKNKMLLIV